jgi:hypothetical protein
MPILDLNSQSDRNRYAESKEERKARETKEFFKAYGQTDREVFSVNGFKGSKDAKCEMAVNFGYIWFAPEKVWIDKNSSFRTKKEETIFEALRKDRGV